MLAIGLGVGIAVCIAFGILLYVLNRQDRLEDALLLISSTMSV